MFKDNSLIKFRSICIDEGLKLYVIDGDEHGHYKVYVKAVEGVYSKTLAGNMRNRFFSYYRVLLTNKANEACVLKDGIESHRDIVRQFTQFGVSRQHLIREG